MDRSDAGVPGTDTDTQESRDPGTHEQPVAPPASQSLPASLEPELRRIIDTAVARVAAIELEAIKEARQITQRSEVEAREALRFALDRAFNLIHSLELLAATVNGMAEALKVELDDAIRALRNVPEPESTLSKELAAPPEEAVEAPVAEEPAPEPAVAEDAPAEPEPQPQPEPAPQQPAEPRVKLAPLVRAADGGQPTEEADEEPVEEPAEEAELATVGGGRPEAPAEPSRKRRRRRFFSRR